MNDQPAEPDAEELLRLIGRVPLPSQSVFDDAREILWTAIGRDTPRIRPPAPQASETGAPAATEAATEAATAAATAAAARRRRAQQRQAGQADGGRRMSLGGGAAPER